LRRRQDQKRLITSTHHVTRAETALTNIKHSAIQHFLSIPLPTSNTPSRPSSTFLSLPLPSTTLPPGHPVLSFHYQLALGVGTGSPIIIGTHGEFWRSVVLLQRPCSTRFLEILEVIEQFRISSPSMNLPFARGPRHPRLSPQKKITVELKVRHAHTLCSSEIAHPARLESPANPRRRGITSTRDAERLRHSQTILRGYGTGGLFKKRFLEC
jgi:hypothetical protein